MADTTSSNNHNYVANDGRMSTFGRGLMTHIKNRTPFSNVSNEADWINPKYKYFSKAGIQRSEALARNSITASSEFNNLPIGGFGKDSSFAEVMYAQLSDNKPNRIRDYRTMAASSEVADALDEICDECINIDDNKNIVKLDIQYDDLNADEKEVVEEEFRKYIEQFDLKNKGWQYFRQLLTEGEVFFEIIVHDDYLNQGVLGLVNIPAEMIDPVYNSIQNMLIKGYIYRKPIYNKQDPTKVDKEEPVPMEENQIIYINSGVYDESKTTMLPFLENCRRPYRQLSLVEDSIIIYRLVRAPERLVFNVDTGTLPPPKAEAYLRKLIQQYWSKKTFDIDQNDVVKKFNPQSMLDAFWFAKRQGSEGTTVTQLPGGANLGELQDLMYFVKKLYRSLKVPTNRLDPEESTREGADILREELKFAKFIVRQQQRFAVGIKKGFITHLKFKGIWSEYELSSTNIDVDFNVPTNFYELRENQKLELKAANYNTLADGANISVTFSQKKYLGWSDKDVMANREFLRKDKEFQWELTQIEQYGPAWREVIIAQDMTDGGDTGEGADGLGGDFDNASGGDGMIPDFGGSPADTDFGGDDEMGDMSDEPAAEVV